ncbi:MAG TPA: alpha/beta fold hydrolase [Terracidiphilus sp.]|nr:alpha/beta fold hydrolase [Terracidiphilus sp.]
MKRTIVFMVTVMVLACNSHALRAQDAGSVPQSQVSAANLSSCAPAAFLILEQGKLAGVDWVEYRTNQVHTRTILTQSVVMDATIDLRPDQTAAHSAVVLTNAGEAPQAPRTRDLGLGAIYLSDMIVSSLEQAVARARVLNQPASHVLATSLYRDSPTDVLVERVDATDWTVTFRSKDYRVLTDEHGCMLSATLPEYGVVIERRTGFAAAQYPLGPPYAAPPDGAYRASDVSIHAPQGHTLAGTLTLPLHRKLVPAAVLIPGLSPTERNGGVPPWMPLRDLADALTRAGIAVLRVDDRGIGMSTGDRGPYTSYDEAEDVKTEVAWLRAQPGIDPKRIALVGYSGGGLIDLIVASKDPSIAAIVSLDGTGVPGAQLAREQTEQTVLHDPSIPAADREKEVEKELAEPLTPRERVFLTIDPLMYAGRVHCPALILHGGSDITVPVRSAEKIANAMRSNGNSDVTVRIIPGVSHSMLPDPIGPGSGWLYLPAFATSPQLLDVMTNWAATHLLIDSGKDMQR